MIGQEWICFHKVSRNLGLGNKYLKDLIEKGYIPFLLVNGRKRFNMSQVRDSLDKLAIENIKQKRK